MKVLGKNLDGRALSKYITEEYHSVKSVQIRSFFWSVFSRIRTETEKIGTRKNSIFGHFSRSVSNRAINEHHGYNENSVESVSTTPPTTSNIKASQKKISSMRKLAEAYGKRIDKRRRKKYCKSKLYQKMKEF